jgi:hypothetical protein
MKFNTLPRIFLEEYDIPNPPVPSLLALNIVMPLVYYNKMLKVYNFRIKSGIGK